MPGRHHRSNGSGEPPLRQVSLMRPRTDMNTDSCERRQRTRACPAPSSLHFGEPDDVIEENRGPGHDGRSQADPAARACARQASDLIDASVWGHGPIPCLRRVAVCDDSATGQSNSRKQKSLGINCPYSAINEPNLIATKRAWESVDAAVAIHLEISRRFAGWVRCSGIVDLNAGGAERRE